MSNMGYCRFRNTLADLGDCHAHMDDDDLSVEEQAARLSLLKECRDIYLDHEYELEGS